MDEIIDWIFYNKEWIFSGIGGIIISFIGKAIFNKRKAESSQTIQSGEGSTNTQAGRDANIITTKKKGDVEEE